LSGVTKEGLTLTDEITAIQVGSRSELRQLVRSQLQLLLEQGNLEGAKALLIPVQPVDIAGVQNAVPLRRIAGNRTQLT